MIFFLPILLALHLLLLNKLTFTAWPEMLSYPYLFANGFVLYRDFIMPYPPGLVLLLSGVFQMFGFSVDVLRVFTWVLILITDLLVFLILKKVTNQNNLRSLIFLGPFILLQSFLDGNMLWFDFVTVLPLLLAFWLGLKWLDSFQLRYLFLVSFFLSLAILIKQTAGLYLIGFGIFYVLIRGLNKIKEIGIVLGGVSILVLILGTYLVSTDSFTSFLNWTLIYPLTEWSKFPGYVDFTVSKKQLLIIAMLLAPLIVSLLKIKSFLRDKTFLWGLLFLTSALLAIYPRFSFFHFQPVIPFLVILIVKITDHFGRQGRPSFILGGGLSIVLITSLLLGGNLGGQIRFYDETEKKLAQTITQKTNQKERVFLFGLNSSQYIFANRLPPINWSDNFGWYLEIPGVQEWVIEGFQKSPPEKVFWRIPNRGNWYELGTYQPREIISYIARNYHLTDNIEGGIEIWTKNN